MANEIMCVFNDKRYGEQYSSFTPDTMEGKVKLFNCINSPDQRLADVINTPIEIHDVVVKKVTLNDDSADTPDGWDDESKKKDSESFRVIIIDDQGTSYAATSNGIYNSVKTILAVFGTLHFDDGLKAVVKQIPTKKGKTLTLQLL